MSSNQGKQHEETTVDRPAERGAVPDSTPVDALTPRPLPVASLTWAAMLGRWVDFARSAVALPTEGNGRLLRDSVPDIIMLQAVWFSLKQIDRLADEERLLGLDRAAVLVSKHGSAMRGRYAQADMPEQLQELLADAERELVHVQRFEAARRAAAPKPPADA